VACPESEHMAAILRNTLHRLFNQFTKADAAVLFEDSSAPTSSLLQSPWVLYCNTTIIIVEFYKNLCLVDLEMVAFSSS
jgi:hypothetical protein